MRELEPQPPGLTARREVEVGGQLPALTTGAFLADIASRHAEREAMVSGGRRSSYRELEADSRRLARALIRAGVVKGTHVALLAGNGDDWVRALFAVGLLGAVLVPVSTFATQEERDYILRHSDTSLLLVTPSLLRNAYLDELFEAHPELAKGEPGQLQCEALPYLRRIVALDQGGQRDAVQSLEDLLSGAESVPESLLRAVSSEVRPSDDGIIIYTSGTTSRPKAIVHFQRAMLVNGLRFTRWMGLEARDRIFSAQPFFWTAGLSMSLIATLDAGACLILQEAFEPQGALDLIEGEQVTTVHAWAHQQKALGEHPSAAGRDLAALRRIPADSPLAKLAGVTPDTDSWGLQGSYGLSETFTIFATMPSDMPREQRIEKSGVPLPGNQLRIIDPETAAPLATGEYGEIAVKGYTLMRGYYKVDPERTLDAEGYFHTGDGGYVDDEGYLHWTGRMSDMIKTGGANVSPVEIEDALLGYEALRVGMPIGVPHPVLDEVIVLCAVRRGDVPDASEEQIRNHLRQKLAAYKVPKRVLFFSADELSYTGNQKIQSAPLREKALERLRREGAEIEGHIYRA